MAVTKLDDDQVMAYPHKLVEHAILNLSDPLCEHLVKLVGCDFPGELRHHFRREVKDVVAEKFNACVSNRRTEPGGYLSSISTCCSTIRSAGSKFVICD